MKWAAVVSLTVLAMAGCGGGDTETKTVTVQESAEAAETTTVVVTETEKTEPEPEEPEPEPEAGEIVVPDVVGEDHQLAQDTMQAAGLYNLSEEDATGEGRLLLFDRNWVVVSQDPPAGTRVTSDQTITLRSKKDGE